MADDRPVAVGFLTRRDLQLLGSGFTRHFPITDDGLFDDLLNQLNEIPPSPPAKADDGDTLES